MVDDRGDLGWWPQASSCRSDGVLQFEVRFAPHSFGIDALRHELAWGLLGLFKKLPLLSPAAATDIPMLDSREIMRNLMAKMQSEYEDGATVYVQGQPVNHLLEPSGQDRPELRLVKLRSPRIVRGPHGPR